MSLLLNSFKGLRVASLSMRGSSSGIWRSFSNVGPRRFFSDYNRVTTPAQQQYIGKNLLLLLFGSSTGGLAFYNRDSSTGGSGRVNRLPSFRDIEENRNGGSSVSSRRDTIDKVESIVPKSRKEFMEERVAAMKSAPGIVPALAMGYSPLMIATPAPLVIKADDSDDDTNEVKGEVNQVVILETQDTMDDNDSNTPVIASEPLEMEEDEVDDDDDEEEEAMDPTSRALRLNSRKYMMKKRKSALTNASRITPPTPGSRLMMATPK